MATVSASGHNNGDHFGTAAAPKQDGGTVIMGGAVAVGDPITNAKSNKDFGEIKGQPYGSKVLINDGTGDGSTGDNTGIGTAKGGHFSSGTIAYMPPASDPQFIIRGVSTKINGSADDAIQLPGSDFGGFGFDGTAEVLTTRALGSGASTEINILAKPSTAIRPERTKGADAGLEVTYASTSGSYPTGDNAAKGTRTRAADLTYMQGAKTPKRTQYPSVESPES